MSGFLKVTYHRGGQSKLSSYLKMPSPTFAVLQREIEMCIFDEHQQPKCELRTYWIDEDNDEIEVVNQVDYEIFRSKCAGHEHLQVTPRKLNGTNPKSTINGENSDSNAIHIGVECDGCKANPLIGFRYKCIQCPDFDLCERCETQHKHPNHMLIRMPHDNCPNVVETWISRAGRRGLKRSNGKGHCPMSASEGADCGNDDIGLATNADDTKDTSKLHHHHRHGRRHQHKTRPSFIMNLYDMMQDLAEGGNAASRNEDTATSSAAASNDEQAAKAANDAAVKIATKIATETAQEVAMKAAQIVSAACVDTAVNETATTSHTTSTTTTSSSTSTSTLPNVAQPEKQQPTENSRPNPNMGSPSLENLAQYVDPQYMKAGIQILNNFSEMFAKMLDPTGDQAANASGSCPFNNNPFDSVFSTRKNSTASAMSNGSGTPSSNANENVGEKRQAQQVQVPEQNQKDTQTVNVTTETVEKAQQTPIAAERRRSRSEENDWQMVDNQPNSDISNVSTASNVSTSTASLEDNDKVKPNKESAEARNPNEINFEQLSKDLKAHVEQEQQKQQQQQQQQNTQSTETATPVATNLVSDAAVTPKPVEEKRAVAVYHQDPIINNSVHAMIAMGFSNEGAWLTQLLESVRGNIPAALDRMSTAQRNSQ